MLKKGLKILLLTAEFLGISLVISIGILFWRLSQGPISLNPILPHIVEALTPYGHNLYIQVESASLEFRSSTQPLNIVITNITVFDEEDNAVGVIPEATVRFSWFSMLKGHILPESIEISSSRLILEIREDGSFFWQGTGRERPGNFNMMALIAAFLNDNDNRYMRSFKISDADLTIKYRGYAHEIPSISLEIKKGADSSKLKGEMFFLVGNQGVNASIRGIYGNTSETLNLTAEISPVNPALSHGISSYHEWLKMLNLTLSTRIEAKINVGAYKNMRDLSFIERIDVVLDGYGGRLRLPFLDEDETYNLRRLHLEGYLENALNDFHVTNFKVTTPETGASGSVKVSGLNRLILERSLADFRIETKVRANDLDATYLRKFWPHTIGPDVRSWLHQNISGGTYKNADFFMSFKGTDEGRIMPEIIDGTVDFDKAVISYIRDMPVVVAAKGTGHVTLDRVELTIRGGQVGGLRVNDGKLVFTHIRDPQEYASIKLSVSGPVREALELIDRKPFRYAREMDIDPKRVTGMATAELDFFFPLSENMTVDRLTARVSSQMSNIGIKDIVEGVSLAKGNLDLRVDNNSLQLRGTGELNGIPSEIGLVRNFDESKFPVFEYAVSAVIDNNKVEQFLGSSAFINSLFEGPMQVKAVAQLDARKQGKLNVSADLVNTYLNLGFIGWNKRGAQSAFLNAEMPVSTTGLKGDIDVKVTDFRRNTITSKIKFAKDGSVGSVVFDRIKGAVTDCTAVIGLERENNINLSITGKALEMLDVFTRVNPAREDSNDDGRRFSISGIMDLDVFSFGEEEQFREVYGEFFKSLEGVEKVNIRAKIGKEDASANFSLDTDGDVRRFQLRSDDAGANLRAIGFIDNIRGGRLNAEGTIDRHDRINGRIVVRNFYFQRAPILAQLLSLASLTGILNTLNDTGVRMSRLEIPFIFENGIISIRDAFTHGSGFGLTARGNINQQDRTLNISGSIVPVYGLNSLLSNIPILGNIFSGERGSGLFNFAYTVRGNINNAEVTVNPLYALAPGMIGGMLRGSNSDRNDNNILDVEEILQE